MDPGPDTPLATSTPAQRQALRMRRFGMAAGTYALGLSILALCWRLGLFPGAALVRIGTLFLLLNLGLLLTFARGWNERFSDPSLTALQVCLAATMVALILVLGRHIQFVATPFYSVLFVFGMLSLSARALAAVNVYVLASYCVAMLVRHHRYADTWDYRVEFVSLALVVGGTVWFAVAAAYISGLRKRLRASLQQIATLASHDALTGLWNRRQIDLELEASVKQASRRNEPLCVALVDIDHFKRINDRHGHAMGDAVLVGVAARLGAALRSSDRVGRYGGEEFLLVLPATTPAQALALAERLRGELEAPCALPAGEPAVTASFGIAAWRGGEPVGDLLRRADRALYRAKDAGRNRVEVDAAA
ncbi:MAG: GGDEF domain-containing protein [Burkholderiales bacterium]|nr:GGDEF domain-containing protein [Burkholderiales bacterium]MDE1927247.1 GGDEF domain-containing protein [Burkholderiales bacterium]MDE2504005.1 GGDEF domain-containing protein [Burkholderiales bacterium]